MNNKSEYEVEKMSKNDEQTILQQLEDKQKALKKRRTKLQWLYYFVFGIALIAIIVVPVVVWINRDYPFTGFIVLYIVVPLPCLPILRLPLRNIEDEMKDLDFEIDLQHFEVSKKESRAEKILLINNYQLRRYYDLTLNQNIWVFGLGIFCIFLGICVIGATFFLLLKVANSLDTKIITGAVGSIGSIMTNYVAAIYLKMHSSASTNLGKFHSRLVDTHQLLFGNPLASRIEDDQIRWQTLSQLALKLADHENIKE